MECSKPTRTTTCTMGATRAPGVGLEAHGVDRLHVAWDGLACRACAGRCVCLPGHSWVAATSQATNHLTIITPNSGKPGACPGRSGSPQRSAALAPRSCLLSCTTSSPPPPAHSLGPAPIAPPPHTAALLPCPLLPHRCCPAPPAGPATRRAFQKEEFPSSTSPPLHAPHAVQSCHVLAAVSRTNRRPTTAPLEVQVTPRDARGTASRRATSCGCAAGCALRARGWREQAQGYPAYHWCGTGRACCCACRAHGRVQLCTCLVALAPLPHFGGQPVRGSTGQASIRTGHTSTMTSHSMNGG